jgi:hypothetical protein
MSVMKKGSKTERSLICLVPRKHTFRVLPETSPHPAMLSTLKKNLSTVKQDV